jgi:hypothetical protein
MLEREVVETQIRGMVNLDIVDSETRASIVEYMRNNRADGQNTSSSFANLLRLEEAANHLGIPSIAEAVSQAITNLIKHKSPEEIRWMINDTLTSH